MPVSFGGSGKGNLFPKNKRQQINSKSGIITRDLQLYLDASNPNSYSGSGTTWNDLSGNANHGTITNGALFSSEGGGSFFFDGINDYVNLPFPFTQSSSANQYTLFVGARSAASTSTRRQIWGSDNGGFDWCFGLGEANRWSIFSGDNIHTGSVVDTKWHIFAAQWAPAGTKLYVDNTLDISVANYGFDSSISPNISIGRNPSGSVTEYFNGYISFVLLYNRALSQEEITYTYNVLYNSQLPINRNLFAYFDANDSNSFPGQGNIWRDLSGRNNTASILNSLNLPTTLTQSTKYGGHVVFNSADQKAVWLSNSNQLGSTNNITMMAWINPTANQGAWAGIIMDRGPFCGMQFDGTPGTALRFMWAGNYFAHNTGITVPPNQWSLVTVVFSPTTITPYLNGTAGTPLSGTFAAQSFSALRLGYDNSTRYYNGKFGAALIFNRALPASEVQQMYDYFKSRYIVTDSNLRLHIDAGDTASYPGSGTAVNDISGNGLNCTLTNGPTFSNGAFILDGSDDFIATNTNIDIRNDFTLEVWISADDWASSTKGYIAFGHGTYTNSQGLHVRLAPNDSRGHLFGMYFNDASSTTVGKTYQINSWFHIVATYSHSSPFTKKLYINGVEIPLSLDHTQTAYANTGTTPLRFGALYGNVTGAGIFHDGKIAQARYYNKVLTASEVLQNYNATRSIFYPEDFSGIVTSPALWFKVDGVGAARDALDNVITTDNTPIYKLFDYSGNQRHAIQASSANQPIYRNAANGISGKPAVNFSSKIMQVANVTLGAFTAFVVFKGSASTLLYELGTTWSQPGIYLNTNVNATIHVRNAANTGMSEKNFTANWGNDNVAKLATHRFNGTHASHILKVNGSIVNTLTDYGTAFDGGTSPVTSTLNIGGRDGSPMGTWNLCELIIFNRALSDSDTEIVESYLRRKWGLV